MVTDQQEGSRRRFHDAAQEWIFTLPDGDEVRLLAAEVGQDLEDRNVISGRAPLEVGDVTYVGTYGPLVISVELADDDEEPEDEVPEGYVSEGDRLVRVITGVELRLEDSILRELALKGAEERLRFLLPGEDIDPLDITDLAVDAVIALERAIGGDDPERILDALADWRHG